MRLVDAENQQKGIVSIFDAKNMADEAGLDLVEVSPNTVPPVCRIMDYGKYLYQQKRKVKLSAKKQHTVTMKEIRLRPEIDDHDRDIKVTKAREFLVKGHRVQFTVMFRGREMMHQDHGYAMMEFIIETLQDISKAERRPIFAGRRLTMVMAPNKQ